MDTGKEPREAGSAPDASTTSRVDLDTREVDVLLKACAKYRRSLPIYLQCVQQEVRTIDQVIRKLSPLRESPGSTV